MIRNFWGVDLKGGKLHNEIAAIKEKVAPLTWEAIEAVRKIGNIGAHMEKDIDLIVDVDPAEAGLLIGLIEYLLNDWYVLKETRQTQLKALVKLGEEKETKKKMLASVAPQSAASAAP